MGKGKLRQYIASTICQLSVMVVGAAYSWFEPITIRLAEDTELDLTPKDISSLTAMIEVGAIISPLVSGYLTNRVGRKYVIMSIAPLCLTGWIIVLCAKTMLALIVVRLLHGLAAGVAFTVSPIYTAEIAEPKLRGTLCSIFQVTWYLGAMYSFCTGPYLNYDMFVYICLPLPIIFALMWIFVPETPYYLLMTKREEEANKILQYFRDGDVEEELQEIRKEILEEMSTGGSWKMLFSDKLERKALIIVQIVSIAKYVTGTTVILNYALETFSRSNSPLPPDVMSIILAAILILVSVISTFLSDLIGRKPLLLISCFGCFVSQCLNGGYYYIHETTTIDSSNFTWALYIGLSGYVFFSDIGVGPLLQTLQSEMFGSNTRGVAAGITEGLAAVFSLIAIKLYNPVCDAYGVYFNFWIYSVVALVCGILLYLLMYETAGKRIGQMEERQNNRAISLSTLHDIS